MAQLTLDRIANVACVLTMAGVCIVASGCRNEKSVVPNPIDVTNASRSERDSALIDDWLQQDCHLGTEDRLAGQLRAKGDTVVPMLVDAFRDGAPASLLQQLVTFAIRDRIETALYIQQGDSISFVRGPAESFLDSLVAAGPFPPGVMPDTASFAQQVRDDFNKGYRSQALVGLAVIATPKARAALKAVKMDASFGATATELWDSTSGGRTYSLF